MNAKTKLNTGKPMPPKLKAGAETKRVQVMVPDSWIDIVDEWRRRQPKIPSRSEAIRIMVENYAKGGK